MPFNMTNVARLRVRGGLSDNNNVAIIIMLTFVSLKFIIDCIFIFWSWILLVYWHYNYLKVNKKNDDNNNNNNNNNKYANESTRPSNQDLTSQNVRSLLIASHIKRREQNAIINS